MYGKTATDGKSYSGQKRTKLNVLTYIQRVMRGGRLTPHLADVIPTVKPPGRWIKLFCRTSSAVANMNGI